MRIPEKFNKKLLVEGNDDQHVVWALCEKHQITENFDVVDCEGISNLTAQLSVRVKMSNIQTIGLIIDADVEIRNRWQAISTALISVGYKVPSNIPIDGLIISQPGLPQLGIWIMPNNQQNGMLEDFISFLVPDADQLWMSANNTLQAIEEQRINKYQVIHKAKALIHTWLAWQEDPGTPMGLAITKKYLTTDGATCTNLVNWIRNTFQ